MAHRNGTNPTLNREQINTVVSFYFNTHLTAKQVARLMGCSHHIIAWHWKPLHTVSGQNKRSDGSRLSIREPPAGMPAEAELAKQQLAQEIAIAKREMADPRTPIYDPEDLEY